MALNNSTISLTINAGETNTSGLITDPHNIFYQPSVTLTQGSGSGQAQKCITQSITVTTGGTTLDLTAIAGGPANANVNFSAIKHFYLENLDATNNLIVGNAASNQWTGIVSAVATTITIGPGGHIELCRPDATGMAVSGGSKSLLIAASASTVALKLIIVGVGS